LLHFHTHIRNNILFVANIIYMELSTGSMYIYYDKVSVIYYRQICPIYY